MTFERAQQLTNTGAVMTGSSGKGAMKEDDRFGWTLLILAGFILIFAILLQGKVVREARELAPALEELGE